LEGRKAIFSTEFTSFSTSYGPVEIDKMQELIKKSISIIFKKRKKN